MPAPAGLPYTRRWSIGVAFAPLFSITGKKDAGLIEMLDAVRDTNIGEGGTLVRSASLAALSFLESMSVRIEGNT